MIKGAIFDADGTLLDSMGMWDTMGEQYLASIGVTARPGLREELFPLTLAECAVYLKDAYSLPLSCQEIEDGINDGIRNFYRNEVHAKAGAREFLLALRQKGVAVTLATATDHAVILEGLARTELLPLLEGVYTCGDLGMDKRNPALFHYVRERIGTRIEETWVFEDAVHAASTAFQAGYWVAGVADPYSDQTALQAVSHIYLPDLTDFPGFYERAKR